MPNDNRISSPIYSTVKSQRTLDEIKELLIKILEKMMEIGNDNSYDPNHGTCCRNGCEKCEQ
jgi:hypothetical protein